MLTLTFNKTYKELVPKIKLHLAVLGKRAVNVRGESFFVELTTSMKEDKVLYDLIEAGAETIVSELSEIASTYTNEEGVSFVLRNDRWEKSDETYIGNLKVALSQAITRYLVNFSLAQFLSSIYPAEKESALPMYGGTYLQHCQVILKNIKSLAYLKRPDANCGTSYDEMLNADSEYWEDGKIISLLTIKRNGEPVVAYNGLADKTADISVPLKVSELENDKGYISGIDSDMVCDALGYVPFDEAYFTKGAVAQMLGLHEWALEPNKPEYSVSEINGLIDALNGKYDKENYEADWEYQLSKHDVGDVSQEDFDELKNEVERIQSIVGDRNSAYGMGYKLLVSKSVPAILYQRDFPYTNTIYEIRSDYTLNDQKIVVPSGCVLIFNGGSVDNGELYLNNTSLSYNGTRCFGDNIVLSGTTISNLTPLMFGAGTGTPFENYKQIYQCYVSAANIDTNVDWSNISSIEIGYPEENITTLEKPLTAIPLLKGKQNDFCGCEFTVKNAYNQPQPALFMLWNDEDTDASEILTTKFHNSENINQGINAVLETCNYTTLESDYRRDGEEITTYLGPNSGRKLLVIEDDNVWTHRFGFNNEEHKRKDCFELYNGKSHFTPSYTYNTKSKNSSGSTICHSLINARLYNVPNTATTIENLIVKRDGGMYKIQIFSIKYMADVRINNVSIITERGMNNLKNDVVFGITDCAHFVVENVNIYGAFDAANQYAYGFYIENGCDMLFKNICTRDLNWGVFGCYSINSITLKDCNINRFDNHLYGKDLKMIDCNFKERYCQFAGVYGKVIYERCKFDVNFKPLIIGGQMNTHVPFDVHFIDCEKVLGGNNQNYLIWMYMLYNDINPRYELQNKCMPNIYVKNLRLTPATINSCYFGIFRRDNSRIYGGGDPTDAEKVSAETERTNHSGITFDYIKEIVVDGLTFETPNKNYPLVLKDNVVDGTLIPSADESDREDELFVYTKNDVSIRVNDARLIGSSDYNPLIAGSDTGNLGRIDFRHMVYDSGMLPHVSVTNSTFSFDRFFGYNQKLICSDSVIYNIRHYIDSSVVLSEENRYYFTNCRIMLNDLSSGDQYFVTNQTFVRCGIKRFHTAYNGDTQSIYEQQKHLNCNKSYSVFRECYEIGGTNEDSLLYQGINGNKDLYDTVFSSGNMKESRFVAVGNVSSMPTLNGSYIGHCSVKGDKEYYWNGSSWV